MKIKHNLKILKDGVTIEGQILDVTFKEGEERGDRIKHYTKDGKFYICSWDSLELRYDSLYIWGDRETKDNKKISCTYSSRKEAQQALDYINEFTIKEEPHYVYVSDENIKPGELVGVNDDSQEKADEDFRNDADRYYIGKNREGLYVVEDEKGFITERNYISNKLPKEEEKIEMSIGEIADKLGIDKSRLLIKG